MNLLTGVLLAITALTIGIVIGRFMAKAGDAGRLAQKLQRSEQELERYKGEINAHFADSATLMAQLAEQYQQLYRHMAEQSRALVTTDESPYCESYLEDHHAAAIDEESGSKEAPRDYANSASGLLKPVKS